MMGTSGLSEVEIPVILCKGIFGWGALEGVSELGESVVVVGLPGLGSGIVAG